MRKDNTVKINFSDNIDPELSGWNDQMYKVFPTPYSGLAGIFEHQRLRRVIDFARIQLTDSVLEIGCEGGNLLSQLPECKRIVGLDISEVALTDAFELCKNVNKTVELFQHDAALPLPFEKDKFDVIICSEVLEHVVEPRKVVENIYAIASSSTRVIVSVPIERVNIFIKKMLKSVGLMKVLLPNVPDGPSDWHLHDFSKNMMRNTISELFEIRRETTVFVNKYVCQLERHEL